MLVRNADFLIGTTKLKSRLVRSTNKVSFFEVTLDPNVLDNVGTGSLIDCHVTGKQSRKAKRLKFFIHKTTN